jgi:hypothetical protein
VEWLTDNQTPPSASDPVPATVDASSPSLPVAYTHDDGFGDSVPFQALALRINRSKGVLVLEGDPADRTEVYLIPRGSQPGKAYFGLKYDPKTPHDPSCASPDGKHGYGWIDADNQSDVKVRACASCPRQGFGAGSCDDLQTLLAYDVEKDQPVLVTFKNAEINPRKGAFTLAVNRMRSMGLKPTQSVFKLSFVPTDGPYSAVQIEVAKADAIPEDKLAEVALVLDNCWAAYRQGAQQEAAELVAQTHN